MAPWEPNPDVNLEGLVQAETAKWQAERMLEKERQENRNPDQQCKRESAWARAAEISGSVAQGDWRGEFRSIRSGSAWQASWEKRPEK